MDHDPGFLGLAHRLVDLAFEVFAVGHEDHHPVAPLLVHEHREAAGQAHPQRGPGRGDDTRLHGLEEETHRVGVQGEGDQGIGLAFEREEAEAIALEAGDEGLERGPGEEEAIGGHVFGGHRAGGVEGEDDVDALALHLLPHDAPLRAGQREDDPGHPHQHEHETQQAKARHPRFHDP